MTHRSYRGKRRTLSPVLVRPRLQLETLEDRLVPTIYVVDNNGDSGAGSLRQAILDANGHAGLDTIQFNILPGGLQTIQPTSALPTIDEEVIVDATTQSGYSGTPLIELDGTYADFADGLTIAGGNGTTIRGLVIRNYQGFGIVALASNNTIDRNYIGTDANGTAAQGNAFGGIFVQESANNWIGSTTVGAGNLISGNLGSGVIIYGASASNNTLVGNRIGVDSTGSTALGNALDGVAIYDASDNRIGGTASGAGNVLSGNLGNGVSVSSFSFPALNNRIQGNAIGTDASGNATLGNTFYGVSLTDAGNTTIGGAISQAGNLIAFNLFSGVFVTGGDAHIERNRIYAGGVGVSLSTNATLSSLAGNDFRGLTSANNTVDLYVDSPTLAVGGIANNSFAADMYYVENHASLSIDLTANSSFTEADNFRIEDRMYHAPDDATAGLVTWLAQQRFVTAPGTGSNDESIAAAISTASGGDTIHLEGGAYTVDVDVNRNVIVKTDGPLTLSGNLTVSNGTFDGRSSSTTIQGRFTQSSGTVFAPTGNLSVSGNWSRSGGSFNANGGTVILNGTSQSISGNTTFFNLNKTVSIADTLTFQAGSLQTVAGTLTLQGASGNALSLRSSTPGTQWKILPQGTRNVNFANVQDSNNTHASAIVTPTSTNSGNNVNWQFGVTVNVAPVLSPVPNQVFSGASNFVDLVATDANSDPLTYGANVTSVGHYLRTTYPMNVNLNALSLNYGAPGAKWFQSSVDYKIWYFILPNGEFHQWNNVANQATGPLLLTVDPAYHANPALITSDPAGQGNVTLSVSGNRLTFGSTGPIARQLRVTATVSDGSLNDTEPFLAILNNLPPTLQGIANQTMSPAQDFLDIGLIANDPDGDVLSYSATVQSQAQIVKGQIGSLRPSDLGVLYNEPGSFNYGRLGEKWISSRDSVGNKISYFILPSGALYRWDGTPYIAQGSLTANVGTNVYANPNLLVSPATAATTSYAGATLRVDPVAGFTGTLVVTARVTDPRGNVSAQTFSVTVAPAPVLTQPGDIAIAGATPTQIALSAVDPSGLPITYSVSSEAMLLKTTYNLSFSGNFYVNYLGLGEKWLLGAAAPGQTQWYYITPAGQLFRWTANGTSQGVSTPVRTIDARYHADPSLLYNAHLQATLSIVSNTLTVTPLATFTGKLVLTVSANNGSFQDSKTFTITVT